MRKLTVIAAAAPWPFRALAVPLTAASARTPTPARLDIAAGPTDVLARVRPAADFRLDYRSGLSLLPCLRHLFTLRPFVGAETTSRHSVWGGGGVELDAHWGQWFMSPTVAVSGYARGAGKKLGSIVGFRSTAEAGWRFDDGLRLSVLFSHTSNAGLTRSNPGTEALPVSVRVSIGALFGNEGNIRSV